MDVQIYQYDAVVDADILIIITEWNQYRNADLKKVKENMRGNAILDTRNVLDMHKVKELGFVYEGVGRK